MDDNLTPHFLDDLQRTGIRPGLGRMRRLMARLGNPERSFPSVLVTGTNGKGSTAAFLDSILRAAGFRTGLFTSPHLVDVRERVRLNGKLLASGLFQEIGLEVLAAMAREPGRTAIHATYFEVLTAIGMLAFSRAGVDIAVVEVGMGGRLDSTNVVDPLVSVLTNVSLDHRQFLGNTVDAIAREKVGVARHGRVLVTAVDDPLFDRTVGPALDALGARACRAGRDFRTCRNIDGTFDWIGPDGARWAGLLPGLPGVFQFDNAALALAAAFVLGDRGFKVSREAAVEGLARTCWPGRLQQVAANPVILLDGCHNPGAAQRLAETLDDAPPARPLVLVHATRPEKDFAAVLERIVPRCDMVIETTAPGLAEPGEIVPYAIAAGDGRIPVESQPDLGAALARARALAGPLGTVLVTGSLYLVGACLATMEPSGNPADC
jgi:dihydrofolate synthase/folylpolyglutamate synthase